MIYHHHQQGRGMPGTLLQILAKVEPETAIWRNGIEYVRIYRVDGLPPEVLQPDAGLSTR